MEILMKLKCSPSVASPVNSRSPHTNTTATVKVIEHHHQLQQHQQQQQQHHHMVSHASLINRTPPTLQSSPGMSLLTRPSSAATTPIPSTPLDMLLPQCMSGYPAPLKCCSANCPPQKCYHVPPSGGAGGMMGMLPNAPNANQLDMNWETEFRMARQQLLGGAGDRNSQPGMGRGVGLHLPNGNAGAACMSPSGFSATSPPMFGMNGAPPMGMSMGMNMGMGMGCCSGGGGAGGSGFESACCSGLACPGGPAAGALCMPPATATHMPHTLLPSHNLQMLQNMSQCAEQMQGSFSYEEPDENFISIDDAKIKGFLQKIGESELQKREQQQQQEQARARAESEQKEEQVHNQGVIFEIIELDDEELPPPKTTQNAKNANAEMQMPETAHITEQQLNDKDKVQPLQQTIEAVQEDAAAAAASKNNEKQINNKVEHLVACIDLLDSSSESENELEADGSSTEPPLPLNAVSCELQELDNDDEVLIVATNANKQLPRSSKEHLQLPQSDCDEENMDFIDEEEEGIELGWEDLDAGQKERNTNYFKCVLCGKKVQSNYNLRRHMMIHTGERPFACDLCERRFREFSDLKKHRRRHEKQSNFCCMICRVNPPSEHDSTRCTACDKISVAVTAVPSAAPAKNAPEKCKTPPFVVRSVTTVQTPPPKPLSQPPSRNATPANITPTLSTATSSPRAVTPLKSNSSPALPPLVPIVSNVTSATQDMAPEVSVVPIVARVPRSKNFPCPLCDRAFGTRHNLKRHIMIHTGEKPFTCSKCNKPFRELSTLKKHMNTHKRQRWYRCHLCLERYSDYLDYTQHKQTHSLAELEQVSTLCDKIQGSTKYDTSDGESNAEDTNEDDEENSWAEDWLECCECGQRFTNIELYTEHLRVHDANAAIYECYICKRTYKERQILEQHMSEVHGLTIITKKKVEVVELLEDDNDDDADADDNDDGTNAAQAHKKQKLSN